MDVGNNGQCIYKQDESIVAMKLYGSYAKVEINKIYIYN
jgi:hypothetical protein